MTAWDKLLAASSLLVGTAWDHLSNIRAQPLQIFGVITAYIPETILVNLEQEISINLTSLVEVNLESEFIARVLE